MEIWKDILNYEGLYQVSNYGNVKSLNRINRNGKTVHEKILSQAKSTSGYLQVNLSKDNKVKIDSITIDQSSLYFNVPFIEAPSSTLMLEASIVMLPFIVVPFLIVTVLA